MASHSQRARHSRRPRPPWGSWCRGEGGRRPDAGLRLGAGFLTGCLLQRLVVCLEESLYIHNIRDMKVLHTIRETPPNPAGEPPPARPPGSPAPPFEGRAGEGSLSFEVTSTVPLTPGL